MAGFNLGGIKLGSHLDWFIYDDTNGLFITSKTIPLKISDNKDVLFAELAIPGLNYTPLQPNRNSSTKLSFQLPIINRAREIGNTTVMSQLEILRNQDDPSIKALAKPSSEYRYNPSVIYYWGTHRPPLRYWVTKCSFEHDTRLTSRIGFSQYTMVDMELTLDEESALYRAYVLARKVGAVIGTVQSAFSFANQLNNKKGNRPY